MIIESQAQIWQDTGTYDRDSPQTRSDWVYERLKQAIVRGELPPGTRLVAAELAQRWAVSPTPLREAFQRLEGVGLVELSSQQGARVAPVSVAEAGEIKELSVTF